MTQFLRMLAALLVAALVAACGGGGGSPGAVAVGTGPSSIPGGTATLSVTDFALFTDKTTMTNGGTDKAQLTVVAVDAQRNVVPGAAVAVTVDQNGIFTPTGTKTDSAGTFQGNLTIGSDKTNRDITMAVTINKITKQTSVRVTGSKVTLQAVPSSPAPGQTVTLNASLVDSSGNPIPGAAIKLGGTVPILQNQTVITGLTGAGITIFSAPTASGVYTITASGNGVSSTDYQLQVFSSAVPAAVIPVGAAPSLSASPNVLATNSPGSSASKSTLRFLFLDSANTPVENVRVRFSDITTGLAKVGASISSGTTTLYTDASGTATVEYIAGQNSSPTNGVTVDACYSATDFASTECPAKISVSLTVAGQALAVSIGDDNLLEKGSGTYIKRFAVTVADSAGRAVANAPVDISVDLTHYGKGSFIYPYLSGGSPTFALSVVPSSLLSAYPSTATNPSSAPQQRVWCANEDTNRNGNVDGGENINSSVDSNNQQTLEPRKSDLIVSYASPTVTTTNASGLLIIKVEYSQRFATWLAYKVRVTANVSGSQGMAERLFVTSFIDGDEENGSFLQPPYGLGSCVSAN